MLNLARKIIGTKNDREIRRYRSIVDKINALEPSMKSLSDDALRGKTEEFKARLAKGETLDALAPEAFAVVREAAQRILGMRHFDVQMIGGLALHEGRISEMKTGEGKTLTATAPVYLNALAGKGVHVVTVNDYLATRDAEHMGKLYGFLGLKTGLIVHGLNDAQRRASYESDVTYGTNNEFGFERSMQTVAVATTWHQTTREFIDDDDLVVSYDVINVLFEDNVGLECLLHVVQVFDIVGIVEVIDIEPFFELTDPVFSQGHSPRLFINDVIAILL